MVNLQLHQVFVTIIRSLQMNRPQFAGFLGQNTLVISIFTAIPCNEPDRVNI